MAWDKKTFLKEVVILHDTREQENVHIIQALNSLNIQHEARKMDFGDYSFMIGGRDFSLSCVIERKANVDEFYGNIIGDRERIEKEFSTGSQIANQFILLLEQCGSMEELKAYTIPDWKMKTQQRKIQNIGEYCYATIKSWQSGNRYAFRTLFVPDADKTAAVMLEEFYYYWRNYKIMTACRRNRS